MSQARKSLLSSVFCLFCFVLTSVLPVKAQTFVQGGNSVSYNSTQARSVTLTTTAGHLIFAVGFANDAPPSGIPFSSTGAESCTSLTPKQGPQGYVQAWLCLSAAGGSETFTSTDSYVGSATRGLLVGEWSGGPFALDQQGLQNQANLQFVGTPSVTTTSSPELLIGYFVPNYAMTLTASGGDTVRATAVDSYNRSYITMVDMTASSLGAYSLTGTWASAVPYTFDGIVTLSYGVPPPPPSITGLSPTSVVAGSSQFTLTITGTGFTTSTAFYWNGTALSCTNVSSTTENCTVPASLVTNGGAAFITLAPTAGSVFTIQHQTALNWLSPNPVGGSGIVASYNIYRGTHTTGPYALLANSPSAAYNDSTVNAGYSYFYVVTTVDTNNKESLYSNEAVASIPIP